jgi:FdhD protein
VARTRKDSSPGTRPARVLAFPRSGGEPAAKDDIVAVEAPLEIRIGGRISTVLMRTPGDDDDLVLGFLRSEGIVSSKADILWVRRPPGLEGDEAGNVLEVEVGGAAAEAPHRHFFGSSGCGVCGRNSIEALRVKGPPVDAACPVTRALLASLPGRMREAQRTFGRTGGVHTSALFTTAGDLVALREDVGRHNALDKVVGEALLQGRVPLSESVLQVSGRTSFEIVQKAAMAGIPIVAAVSAPSSLAVASAKRMGMTLVGFVRGDRFNVYAHPERIDLAS